MRLVTISVLLSSIALVAAGSSQTSVLNHHGGSYTYGIDHDNYGAWYGTAYPSSLGGVASDHGISGIYGHGVLTHAPLSHGDVSYGYETYGAGFGHGDYGQATSYQNHKMQSVGGEKIIHTEHGVNHGHGATSYQSVYQKTGSGLYGGFAGDYGYNHGNYAGSYGHGSYGGISSQHFNLKSYVHHPIAFDIGSHYVENYQSPVSSYGHEALGYDFNNYNQGLDYSHGIDYSHGLDYSQIHVPSYGHDLGNYGYSSYGDGYPNYGYGQSSGGYGNYLPSYSGLSYY